jgi:hypothetical protein
VNLGDTGVVIGYVYMPFVTKEEITFEFPPNHKDYLMDNTCTESSRILYGWNYLVTEKLMLNRLKPPSPYFPA